MSGKRVLVLLAVVLFAGVQASRAAGLPVCSNRVVSDVMKRTGCSIGDKRCWLSKGGYCTDYIRITTGNGQPGDADQWARVLPEDVRKGDVARFRSRLHFAYVESVQSDKNGKSVAVDLSEYNYGDCWVDRENLVTDKYMMVNKRSGVALGSVSGGFWRRKQPAGR